MSNAIIYRRADRNTTPRGFGNPPTYHCDEITNNDTEMVWVDPVEIILPEGYTIAEANDGHKYLYDEQDKQQPIVDDHGHPAIVTGKGRNKEGKPFLYYKRLDK